MEVVSSLTFLTHLSSVPWHLITRTHFPSEAFIPQDLTCAPSPLSAVCSLSLSAPSVLTSPRPLLPPSALSALSLVSRQVGQRPPVGSGQPRWARALPHVLIQACISPAAAPASFDHRIIRMNLALEAVRFDPRLSVDTVYITSPWLGKRGGLTVIPHFKSLFFSWDSSEAALHDKWFKRVHLEVKRTYKKANTNESFIRRDL